MPQMSGGSRRPIIGIMGASDSSRENMIAARELGRLLAERGWIVLTGGRPAGVMAAACEGAKQVPHSMTLGILPGSHNDAAADVDLAVFTGMGDARNVINVLTSDVIVACGVDSAGTASEVSLALVSGTPLILLGASEAAREFFGQLRTPGRIFQAATPQEATDLLERELGIRRLSWR